MEDEVVVEPAVETKVENTEVKPTESVKPKADDSKQTDYKALMATIESLQAEKSKLLEKNDNLNKDLSKERGAVKEFRVKEKKSNAVNTKLGSLGEDWEVSGDKLNDVLEIVSGLPDSEDLDAKIDKLFNVAKTPKVKGAKITSTPFLSNSKEPQIQPTNEDSMWELAKTNPEAFKKARPGFI